jgi:hypothetical protein
LVIGDAAVADAGVGGVALDDVDARDDRFEDIVAFGYEAKSGGDAGFGAAVYHGVSVTGGEFGIWRVEWWRRV